MSDRAPRLAVPADFLSLDDAAYGSGAPSPSALGAALAGRERWLARHLRRHLAGAWPLNQASAQTVIVRRTNGELLGPMDLPGTPGVKAAEWELVALLPAGATARVVPFISSPPIQPPRRALESGMGITIMGTGAEETYGPIRTPAVDGLAEGGLALFPDVVGGGATVTGAVAEANLNVVVSGDTNFSTSGVGPGWVIRLRNAATDYITDWHDVLRLSDAYGVGLAVAIAPMLPFAVQWSPTDYITWEALQLPTGPELIAWSYRELAE